MNLSPASSTTKHLDFFGKSNESARDWLKEDSTTKTIVTRALYLAGPKGAAIAKGIEVASFAASLLDKDRSQATQGFQQSGSENIATRLQDAGLFTGQSKEHRQSSPKPKG